MGPNLISWSSKKQHTVSRSSTESEYRALAHTTADVVWILQLLSTISVSLSTIPIIWCDNRSAIALAHNPISHARTKHIEIDCHFIRDKVLAKQIQLQFIASAAQVANLFTKPLPKDRFRFLSSKLMVVDPPIRLRGHIVSKSKAPDNNHKETGGS